MSNFQMDLVGLIIAIELPQHRHLDRTTTANISLSATGQSWLYAYQGNSVNITGFVATITQGSATITLTTSPTTASGYKFRAGDYIQLGSTGKVYQVAADVAYNSNTVTLNRPVIDAICRRCCSKSSTKLCVDCYLCRVSYMDSVQS
jgi:hypothetical protein